MLRAQANPAGTNTRQIASPPSQRPPTESKSRKRTLSAVTNVQSLEDTGKGMSDQVQARDAQIADLNAQMIELKSAMKVWESQSVASLDRQLRTALDEKIKLHKENHRLETLILTLETNTSKAAQDFELEKEDLMRILQDRNEQVIVQKTEITALLTESENSKSDLEKLSTILQEMSKMNKDLNGKIESLNADMEQANKEKYELTLQIQSFNVLESDNSRLRTDLSSMETRLETIYEMSARLSAIETVLEEAIRKLDETEQGAKDENQRNELRAIGTLLISGMKQRKRSGEVSNSEVMQVKLKQAKNEVDRLGVEIYNMNNANEAQKARIRYLEAEFEKSEKEIKRTRQAHATKTTELQELVESQRKSILELKLSKAVLDDKVQRQMSDNDALKSKVAQAKAQTQEMKKQQESLRTTLRTLQSDFLQLKSDFHTQENKNKSKDRTLIELQTKVKVMTEELWKKESDVLKKESVRIRLEEEIRILQNSNFSLIKGKSTPMRQTTMSLRRDEESVQQVVP